MLEKDNKDQLKNYTLLQTDSLFFVNTNILNDF